MPIQILVAALVLIAFVLVCVVVVPQAHRITKVRFGPLEVLFGKDAYGDADRAAQPIYTALEFKLGVKHPVDAGSGNRYQTGLHPWS